MISELAQAIRDLATYGRLSPESEENLSTILDAEDDQSDDTKESEDDKSDAKSTTTKSTTATKATTGGNKS